MLLERPAPIRLISEKLYKKTEQGAAPFIWNPIDFNGVLIIASAGMGIARILQVVF